jgi:arylformamidase
MANDKTFPFYAEQPVRKPPPVWFDDQYNNRARIPEHPSILKNWFESSARALERHRDLVEVAYGTDASERLDVFPASSPMSPVLVYVHGGYWRALDKRAQSFVAPPFVDAGAMVVLPGYALCPAVTIDHIALQLVRALVWVHDHAARFGGDPARIVVAGHSAGGHLATLLLACHWQAVRQGLPADVVKAALSISGLYDLEPLRHAPFLSSDLNLTAATALRLSPAAMAPPRHGVLAAVVGADESGEFLRQAALIEKAWGPQTVIACEHVANRNHMNVLDGLADPESRTHRLALELLGLSAPLFSQPSSGAI